MESSHRAPSGLSYGESQLGESSREQFVRAMDGSGELSWSKSSRGKWFTKGPITQDEDCLWKKSSSNQKNNIRRFV